MKIDRISDTDYRLYIFADKIDKDIVSDEIKKIVKKLQKKLKLRGFYKVITSLKDCGLFLQLVKIEDSFYRDTLDLRIVFEDDLNVYFKTNDYFIVDCSNIIRYFDENYYALVDDSFEKIIEKVEFGDFVFGSDVDEMLNYSLVL